jgi:large subunit ribosomal protein L28
MAKICQITGKKVIVGNNVSHAKNRTKRTFEPNLFDKKLFVPSEQKWVKLKVSAAGLRVIDKNGIEAALKSAQEKGFYKAK